MGSSDHQGQLRKKEMHGILLCKVSGVNEDQKGEDEGSLFGKHRRASGSLRCPWDSI